MLQLPPEPQELAVDVRIEHITSIAPATLSFGCHFNFLCCTSGSNSLQEFAFRQQKQQQDNSTFDMAWNVKVSNVISAEDRYAKSGELTIMKLDNGAYFQRAHLVGTFAQYFHLDKYPFDFHTLKLVFDLDKDMEFARFDEKNVRAAFSTDSILLGLGGVNWDIGKPYCQLKKFKKKRHIFHRLIVHIPIHRRAENFLYQVLFPLLITDFVAMNSYFLELEPIYDRMDGLVALLLTYFTFKWTVGASLPPVEIIIILVPYLTMLDRIFNISYAFFLIHALIAVVMGHFAESHHLTWNFEMGIFLIVLISYLFFRLRQLKYCFDIGKHALLFRQSKKRSKNVEHNDKETDYTLNRQQTLSTSLAAVNDINVMRQANYGEIFSQSARRRSSVVSQSDLSLQSVTLDMSSSKDNENSFGSRTQTPFRFN
ncbi:hypothetical protein RFI_27346 [Reticulomyxa filosa]|uniref:Uncharacterized protein n=1 Tax=Reticulomyxa filosa TaxID=46433 RepID=X6M977_RETFI|nr:hypothetical protein RFI_27346 [Reticulomyxa filosa]|eukprot:ETO10032.1 hypothetical protein RFI_27346 [Reticulomyxa filosa]